MQGCCCIREVEQRTRSRCRTDRVTLRDHRDPRIEGELTRNRGVAWGSASTDSHVWVYAADLNDHDSTAHRSRCCTVVSWTKPISSLPQQRRRQASDLPGRRWRAGVRMTPVGVDRLPRSMISQRYKKIAMDLGPDRRLDGGCLRGVPPNPGRTEEMRAVIPLDATDDLFDAMVQQEGRFFHGYYRHYC